jgi:hypothetical protein
MTVAAIWMLSVSNSRPLQPDAGFMPNRKNSHLLLSAADKHASFDRRLDAVRASICAFREQRGNSE